MSRQLAEFYERGINKPPDKWQEAIQNNGKSIIDWIEFIVKLLMILLTWKLFMTQSYIYIYIYIMYSYSYKKITYCQQRLNRMMTQRSGKIIIFFDKFKMSNPNVHEADNLSHRDKMLKNEV